MPKVNEGINLLLEIRYLVKTDDKLTVIKWGEKQSEYCQKLTKRQNQAGDQNPMRRDTVGTLSGQKPDSVGQEERRGEEIKGEEKENGSPPKFSETPSWEEFWAYCQSPHCGIAAEWYAKDKFWAACQDKWQKKSDWRAYARRVRGWWDNDGRPMKPVQNYGNKNTKKPNARNFGIAEDPAEAGRRTVANAAKRAAERAAERAGQKTT